MVNETSFRTNFGYTATALLPNSGGLPRHHSLPKEGRKCNLCVRYEVLPCLRLLARDAGSSRAVLSFEFLKGLFPVGDPDVLDVHGVIEEPPAFSLLRVEPVNGTALVGENLLQIPDRECFCRRGVGFIGETPDGVDIVMLGQRFQ